jgi:serine/threonine-protein kinase RsbT
VDTELRVPISTDQDIVTARQEGRRLASQLDFSSSDLTVIASAISEIARNILEYARHGEVHLSIVERGGRKGIAVTARDEGPGIPDVALALQDGFSTSGSLGLGLPGVRRLMDEFEIRSAVGEGTAVLIRKWAR